MIDQRHEPFPGWRKLTHAERVVAGKEFYERYLHAYPIPTPEQLATVDALSRLCEAVGKWPEEVVAWAAGLKRKAGELSQCEEVRSHTGE